MQIKIGQSFLWVSPNGYSKAGGEIAEVYAVDEATHRACINVAGDAQCPEGYSYSVSCEELFEITAKRHAQTGSEIGSRDVTRAFAALRLRRMRKLGRPSLMHFRGMRIYQLQGAGLSYAVTIYPGPHKTAQPSE